MIVLRRNFGSFPVVDRVLCYDAAERRVSVLYKAHHGQLPCLDTVGVDELEVDGTTGDPEPAVRSKAQLIINREEGR